MPGEVLARRNAKANGHGPFSLTAGGPFYRLLVRLGMGPGTNMLRAWWLAAAMWVPMAIGEGVRLAGFGGQLDPLMRDLSVHVRLLVALPILIAAERLLEDTARSAMNSMYVGKFCDVQLLDRVVARAMRFRDSAWAEIVIAVIAVVGGQLALWRVVGPSGVFAAHGDELGVAWTFPRVWYAVVALPFVQFVLLRWVWRWLIWCYVVVRISRLPLQLLATHADGACGLVALARPMNGFSGFTFACSSIVAAAWGTKIIEGRETFDGLLPLVAVFLVIALAAAAAPLLSLSGHLFRARRRTLAQYGDFMRAYVLQFHAKWIEARGRGGEALGTSDIQSLADLGHSFGTASKTRMFVFGPRNVLAVWFAGFAPMIPLFASRLTVQHVIDRIARTILGGLPF